MAGRIPQHFIDEILMRVDIVEVIDARVPLKKAGKDFTACCPFHDEKTPSFTVSPAKQFYHCFGCGAHGTAIGFLMEYDHLSFPEAVRELAGRVGVAMPEAATPAERESSADLYGALEVAAKYYREQLRVHPQAPRAISYLKDRGISSEMAADFGLGFAPEGWDNLVRAMGRTPAELENLVQAGLAVKKDGGGYYDRFRERVMFPIADYRGRVVGFGGRVLADEEPKYLNSPETPLFHKGRELYGLYRAREAIKREGRVLIVEGYMDVIALTQFGLEFAVATLGTATTREQLERVFRFVPDIIFCFDGDRAGREAAWRALENALPVVHEGRQLSFLFLPEGEDPDSLVRKEGGAAFANRIKEAVPLPEFLFQSLVRQVDLNRLDGRARLVELARPLLSKLRSGLFQEMLLERLAEVSRVARGALGFVSVPAATMGKAVSQVGPQPPPSLVRMAIGLLVQHPALAGDVTRNMPHWAELDLPGILLFNQLVDLLRIQPQLNTAALLEKFRDSEHQHSLAKLAAWRHPILDQDVRVEFLGVLSQMRRAANKAGTERLLLKQRVYGLEPNEKTELAQLLAEKSHSGGIASGG